MTPFYDEDDVTIYQGDCRAVLEQLPANSIDTCLTDPPYGLSFMGKGWDHAVPGIEFWSAVLRVMKPGASLLAFGGTRTYHRLACAIEDAGFELRDCLMWLYGSGFPKSMDISKAIDKQRNAKSDTVRACLWIADRCDQLGLTKADLDEAAGTSDMGGWWASRLEHRCQVPTLEQWQKIETLLGPPPDWIKPLLKPSRAPGEAWSEREVVGFDKSYSAHYGDSKAKADTFAITAPSTDTAKQWHGYGTALKPAWEPIILAMKPTDGTFAENALRHGVAGLHIDGGRIGTDERAAQRSDERIKGDGWGMSGGGTGSGATHDLGRWPANLLLDQTAAAMLDTQSGEIKSGNLEPHHKRGEQVNCYGKSNGAHPSRSFGGDQGGASRFFYVAKASRSERGESNDHPTVKPTKLIEYLCRLTATPTGGVVLDPFLGSGTTALACRAVGRPCIGIELESRHCEIAADRLKVVTPTLF